MANKRILCDKTEIIFIVLGKKKATTLNLTYDKIQNIRFEKCKEFRFFRMVPSERILITNSKTPEPLVYKKYKEKKFFEEYKQDLEKFAKNNRITFYNNL